MSEIFSAIRNLQSEIFAVSFRKREEKLLFMSGGSKSTSSPKPTKK
jgi:hypothetical protein